MTNFATRIKPHDETRARRTSQAIVRWMTLTVVASLVALMLSAQTRTSQAKPEPAPEQLKRTQKAPEKQRSQKKLPDTFHSTIAIIINAPKAVHSDVSVALAKAFSEIRDADVYVFSGKFEKPPDWTISVSADVIGPKDDPQFVMGVVFSRVETLVDPRALNDAMENKTEIPTTVAHQMIVKGRRGTSDFRGLWVAQGSIKKDLKGASQRAASLFDHNFLDKERKAFQQTTPAQRRDSSRIPRETGFPH